MVATPETWPAATSPVPAVPTPTEPPTPWVRPTPTPPASPARTVVPPPVVAVEEPTPTPVPPTPTPTMPPITAVFECQKGAVFRGSPDEMDVFINGQRIGTADDWDGMGGGQVYMFPREGTYLAMLQLAGYQTVWVQIVVKPTAEDEIVKVGTDLEKESKKKK